VEAQIVKQKSQSGALEEGPEERKVPEKKPNPKKGADLFGTRKECLIPLCQRQRNKAGNQGGNLLLGSITRREKTPLKIKIQKNRKNPGGSDKEHETT